MPARLLLIALLAGLSACGYRFAGNQPLPAAISPIFIPVFENRTSAAGIETLLTEAVILEFLRARQGAVTTRREEARTVLEGRIETLRNETVSYFGTEVAAERRVTLGLRLVLKDGDGKVVWQSGSLSDSQTYRVGADKPSTEESQRTAISEIAERVAEAVYLRIGADFL